MSRVLLTGGGGFVGQWVARAALERGDDVLLAGLGAMPKALVDLASHAARPFRWISADMCRPADVHAMVGAATPDIIIHLAGVAFPPQAENDPAATYDVNTLGAVRVLAAVAARVRAGTLDPEKTTIVIVGSALQYGVHAAAEMPLAESAEQRPITVYAASKTAQEVVSLHAARSAGLRVICTRSFNHAGPGQPAEYLLPSLVRRVVALRDAPADAPRQLGLGNDAVRDYLHVSDVADAYLALADRGTRGEVYNVCSGNGVRVSELAADILRRAEVTAETRTESSLARATDIPVLVGSAEKLMSDTGWAPRKTHADIIDDLLRSVHAATD